MAVYWDETKMQMGPHGTATILAFGDSWFWYPLPGGCLLNYLGDVVGARGHVILAKGMNGAETHDYVDGKYRNAVRESLRLYGPTLSAVFISGGGNDFAGFNDLRPLLKTDCSAETLAAQCFRNGTGGFDQFLVEMDEQYRALIGLIYTRTSVDCHIVMHSYDYAPPTGEALFGREGWLRPALVDAGVVPELFKPCVDHLIDGFHGMLLNIAKGDPQHLHVVDSRGTLGPSDWANELHPNGRGFKKIAVERWKPVLQPLNLA
ncbi:hypothetical protein CY658_00375 [Variovorax sp. RO1]|uniref:SGNH/GDSL hydrolase family protein n=1 Tax=Variovorax sp. RO1 TaxID=2066034 RepID=UPI000C716CD8|nr:SGNH/GDSL hydrolase family protein [Variovorax sp. RO1]PLC05585.1 hypothetical protein CY658_00375 [Variovorax sp. RO1]